MAQRTPARVGVVGLGAMGSGIAQLCVEAGYETIARDVSDEATAAGRVRIAHFLERKVAKEQLTDEGRSAALDLLRTTTDLGDLANTGLVIEAIVEDLPAKLALVAELDTIVGDDTILATNTSALSVTAIAAGSASPHRVVGMHFFNPAPSMPLVEIVRAEQTSAAVVETAFAFAESIGKQPIRCDDTPGFVVNRVLVPLLNDCIRVLDETGVSIEDLDRAMTLGAGWPMGPGALGDLVGLDVQLHASEALYGALREPRMAPPPRLVRLVQAGALGRKTGRGFYDYERGDA